ncbi:SDR family NAD(P)-dependent oxidoreductase [Granulicoccus sp. GXG6511]|uniref:SDR family NAD(P)-dependent oxidoreductase n=1 Tax=Granulicoccus sp. GXG6511 TaxID=3381351 RepID=UPI003D7E071C
MDIASRTALVTGGTSGLGLATVRALAAAGARVVVIDLPSSSAQETLAEFGAAVRFVAGDVTDPADVQQAIDEAVALGDFAIVVNCAGIGTPASLLDRQGQPFPLELFTTIIQVNLIGTFNVVRLAAKAIAEHTDSEAEDRAVIINTASIAAFDGQIGQAAYAASKGGVAAMTLPLARELARHRIRVVTIAPGVFRTPMLTGFPPDIVAALGAQVPHPSRLGEPGEFALLATQIMANPMLNGETIRLDGAIRMPPR